MERTLFGDEHEEYRRSIRAFLTRNVVDNVNAWEREGIVPRSLFTGLGELGALSFGIPAEYGGSGVDDFRFNAVLSEEAAALGVGAALLGPTLVADVCVPYLVDCATDAQKSAILPGVAAGELILAIAMTEPGAGSDLAGIRTRATQVGDHFVVDGAKMFITNGLNADVVITAVRTSDHPRSGLTLLLVDTTLPGVIRAGSLEKMGMHAQDTAEIVFDGVRVPATMVLGEIGGGFEALTRHLPQERLSLSVAAVAAARQAWEDTCRHVREREAFGAPLGALQLTRVALAEIATEIDVATSFVDDCIRALNAGALSRVDAAKAKWWATEMQGRVLDRCVQLHGGYGYMREHSIARAWADARVTRIYGGSTETLKDLIGRSLDLGRHALATRR